MQNADENTSRDEGSARRPKQKRSEATVAAILEASIEILSTDGGSGFNTNRISRRAGVSIGTLYQYFKDREAILLELSRRHFAAMSDVLTSFLESSIDSSFESSARVLIRATVQLHVQNPRLHDALSRMLSTKQANGEDGSAPVKDKLAALYRRHQQQLQVADVKLAAFVTYEMVEHLVHRVVAHKAYQISAEALEDEIFRMVSSYLQSGVPPARVGPKSE